MATFGQNCAFQFFLNHFGAKDEENWNGQIWMFQIFSNHFGAKRLEEIRNGQN